MSDSTPRLGLPDLPDTPELYADIVADAFGRLDAFTDLYLKGQFVNTPPSSPADGDAYLTGGAPTGAWSGYAYKIATCRDGGWVMLAPFDGLRAFVEGANSFIVYAGGAWTDWTALISAGETSIASAATCDLGAAGSLFLDITGTTAITSLGTGANRLRFVRFAGALTLTYNATSLILPGSANIATAAGDTAIFASDASGNWRCRSYSRANGVPLAAAGVTGTGNLVLSASPVFSGNLGIGMTPANVLDITQNQNAQSKVGLLNNNGSGAAQATFVAGNGTKSTTFGIVGTGFPASGVFTANTGYLGSTGDLAVSSGGAVRIAVNGSNAQVAGVGSDGSLLVNTTSNGGPSGLAKFAVFNNNTNVAYIDDGDAGTSDSLIVRKASTSGTLLKFISGASTGVGSITTNGTLTGYNTTSDARLKTVLPQQADYRDAIRALWVGDFTWTDSGAPGFGVLAQQAFAVMPNHQGVTAPADETGTWQASAEPFAHLALWGAKDLYALVEALAARVAILEAAHDAG